MDNDRLLQLAEEARQSKNYAKALEYYKTLLKQGDNTWDTTYYALYCAEILKGDVDTSFSAINDYTDELMDKHFDSMDQSEKVRFFKVMIDTYIEFANVMLERELEKEKNHDEAEKVSEAAQQGAYMLDDLVTTLSCFSMTDNWQQKLRMEEVKLLVAHIEHFYRLGFIRDKEEYRDDTEEIRDLIKKIRKTALGYVPPEPNIPEHLKTRLAPPPVRVSSPSSDSGAQTSSQSSGGCYIATNVYGSYDCPQVWVLRRFRDDILAGSTAGRYFIKIYYALSPGFVARFGNFKKLNSLIKYILDRFICRLKNMGIKDTPYTDKKY